MAKERGGRQRVELQWSDWQPHEGCWLGDRLPRLPGLYRIRRVGRDDVDYLGQAGLTLRERQGMLRRVYDDREMPYRDPHTAAPALWALHQATGCAFEVSVMPYTGPYAMRLSLEAVAIAQYRQGHGARRRSSSAGCRRVTACRRATIGGWSRRGSASVRTDQGDGCELPAEHTVGWSVDGRSGGCRHTWSAWMPAAEAVRVIPSGANGLYRLRVPGRRAGLVYVGQGVVRSRVGQHLRKPGNLDEPLGAVFRADMECAHTCPVATQM